MASAAAASAAAPARERRLRQRQAEARERAGAPDWELYLEAFRPWMALLGKRVAWEAGKPAGAAKKEQGRVLALSEDLTLRVFALVDAPDLAALKCVCRYWRRVAAAPRLWESACLRAWQLGGEAATRAAVQAQYGGDWHRMYMERPRLRTDGIYVSRNTYIRRGVVEWDNRDPVHLVAYYRYLRFFPDGVFLYKTSPETVKRVAKLFQRKPGPKGVAGDPRLMVGRWTQRRDSVYTSYVFPEMRHIEMRCHLRLRSKVRGANNRMDILRLVSFNRDEQEYSDVQQAPGPDDPSAETYTKGCNTYVFVPFPQTQTHVLNLPTSELDFYVTG